MRHAWLWAWAAAAASAFASPVHAYEINAWPAVVLEKDEAGQTQSWTALGPFLFSRPGPSPEGGALSGFRPLHVRAEAGGTVKTDMLYPLFYFRQYDQGYTWSVLQLIDGKGTQAGLYGPGSPADTHFDLWPFYFSHSSPDAGESYQALFPIAGTVKHRLGFQRLSWVAFPLYAQSEKPRGTVTYAPWPILRVMDGAEKGFALWPLYGHTEGPGRDRRSFALWPFFWDNTVDPGPEAPDGTPAGHQVGILPLYTRETASGYLNETYLWPFFGHSERTVPYRYTEKRYFWPFIVMAHGDDRSVFRLAPLYTHSEALGGSSTWNLWPVWHVTSWVDGDLRQTKSQLLYFVYWSLDQESVARPALAHAYKRHLWPLVSAWDNGAGSRQVQVPSPLEVFFPDNPDVRQTWTPFFALYRYERRPDGEEHGSLLWNAVTWRSATDGTLKEFHLGPLLGVRRAGGAEHWQILGFDLPAKPDENGTPLK